MRNKTMHVNLSATGQMNQVSTFDKPKPWGKRLVFVLFIPHALLYKSMCSYQTCPTAKPATAAVHIQLNLLKGSKGGEMTSRSTQ